MALNDQFCIQNEKRIKHNDQFQQCILFEVVKKKRLDYVLYAITISVTLENVMFNSMHYLPLLCKCKNVQVFLSESSL